jgi:hypothetical protein
MYLKEPGCVGMLTAFDCLSIGSSEHDNELSAPHTRVYPKVSGLVTWSENCK